MSGVTAKTPWVVPGGSVSSLEAAGRVAALLREDDHGVEETAAITDRVAGYVLSRRLGEGGSGVVYLGYREGSDRPLAIKLMRRSVGAPEQAAERKRAWRELEILTQLRLEAVPRVIDYGLQDGRLYLAVEFVDGQPLMEYCRGPGVDRRARVALLARIADAVQTLHEHGVLHRDLKPSNILVDRSGNPVIVDLGIATMLSGTPLETLTTEGVPIGSPAFMSPEQARGERNAVGVRSDVFGLGSTACFILTGKTPHDTDTTVHEAVRRVAQDEARAARTLDRTLPAMLAAIIDKAAAHDPAVRYGSAVAFAADLRRWLGGQRVQARQSRWVKRLGRTLGRHPLLTTGALCVAMALATLTGLLGAVWQVTVAPAAVEVDPADSSWARLVTAGGRVLHRWEAGPEGITRVQLFTRADGQELVLIGYGAGAPEPVRGRLCAYSVEDPERLLWARQASLPEPLPAGTSLQNGRDPSAALTFITADVFSEVAGDEIVAVYRYGPNDPSAVRVYGQGGGVLDEVWHAGPLSSVAWMARARLLVACGVNCETATGRQPGGDSRSPRVVFAFQPREGRSGAFLRPDGLSDVKPAWYRCVLSPQSGSGLAGQSVSVGPPQAGYKASEFVQFSIATGADGLSTAWVLDAAGRVVEKIAPPAARTTPGRPDPTLLRLGTAADWDQQRSRPHSAAPSLIKAGRSFLSLIGGRAR